MKPTPAVFERAMAIANNPRELMERLFDEAYRQASQGRNILEIGTDRGGSALVFMDAMSKVGKPGFLVTVDPWGHRPYPASDSRYGDTNQRDAMRELANFAADHDLNWHHFKLPSAEFLANIAPLGCWYTARNLEYRWGLVFLDGEHVFPSLHNDLKALLSVMDEDGRIIIDNANHRQDEHGLKIADKFVSDGDGYPIEEIMARNAEERLILPHALTLFAGLNNLEYKYEPMSSDAILTLTGFR